MYLALFCSSCLYYWPDKGGRQARGCREVIYIACQKPGVRLTLVRQAPGSGLRPGGSAGTGLATTGDCSPQPAGSLSFFLHLPPAARRPSAIHPSAIRPSAVVRCPPAARRLPPALRLPPTTYHRPPPVLPSAVRRSLSAARRLPPTTARRPSSRPPTYRPPPAVRPSAAGCQCSECFSVSRDRNRYQLMRRMAGAMGITKTSTETSPAVSKAFHFVLRQISRRGTARQGACSK